MHPSFGPHLRELREAKGLTREDLVYELRRRFGEDGAISTSMLGKWEKNQIPNMGAGSLANVVEVLEADYEDVFSRLVTDPGDAPGRPVPEDVPESPTPPADPSGGARRGRRPGNGSRRRRS